MRSSMCCKITRSTPRCRCRHSMPVHPPNGSTGSSSHCRLAFAASGHHASRSQALGSSAPAGNVTAAFVASKGRSRNNALSLVERRTRRRLCTVGFSRVGSVLGCVVVGLHFKLSRRNLSMASENFFLPRLKKCAEINNKFTGWMVTSIMKATPSSSSARICCAGVRGSMEFVVVFAVIIVGYMWLRSRDRQKEERLGLRRFEYDKRFTDNVGNSGSPTSLR